MIERGKFRSLTLVNWNGFFARTFDLDALVTTLSGGNGAGKSTTMAAFVTALIPDLTLLHFRNTTEAGATSGSRDRGLHGKLRAGVCYSVLEVLNSRQERILFGVRLQQVAGRDRKVDIKPFVIQGAPAALGSTQLLTEQISERQARVLSLAELKTRVEGFDGAQFRLFNAITEYHTLMFEYGVIARRLRTPADRSKFYRLIEASLYGGISSAITRSLRDYLLPENGGVRKAFQDMEVALRENRMTLEAIRVTQADRDLFKHLITEATHYVAADYMRHANARRAQAEQALQLRSQLQESRRKQLALQYRLVEINRELAEYSAVEADLEAEYQAASDHLNLVQTAVRQQEKIERYAAELEALTEKLEEQQFVVEEATEAHALSEARVNAAEEEVDALQTQLASYQQALDMQQTRAIQYQQAQQLLTRARELCQLPELTADNAADHLAQFSAREQAITERCLQLEQKQRLAEAAQQQFDAAWRCVSAIRPDVAREQAWQTARELINEKYQHQQRASQCDTLTHRLAELEQRLQQQQDARQRLESLSRQLGKPCPPDALAAWRDELEATRQQLTEVVEEVSEQRAAWRQTLAEIQQQTQTLTQRAPVWIAAQEALAHLSEQCAAPLESSRQVTEYMQQLLEQEREITLQREEAGARKREVEAQIERLSQPGGAEDPRLSALAERFGGVLLSEIYDDITLDDAPYFSALYGPARHAIVVPELARIRAELDGIEDCPEDVYFIEGDPQSFDDSVFQAEELTQAVIVTASDRQWRYSRFPQVPIFGRAAREQRLETLRAARETLAEQYASLSFDLQKVQRLHQAFSQFVGTHLAVAFEADPEEALRQLTQRRTETERRMKQFEQEHEQHLRQFEQVNAGIDQLNRLLPYADILGDDTLADQVEAVREALEEARTAQAFLQRYGRQLDELEPRVSVLQHDPQHSAQEAEAYQQAQAQQQQLRQQTFALTEVVERRAHFGYADAAGMLSGDQDLNEALRQRLAHAEEERREARAQFREAQSQLAQSHQLLASLRSAHDARQEMLRDLRQELNEIGVQADPHAEARARTQRDQRHEMLSQNRLRRNQLEKQLTMQEAEVATLQKNVQQLEREYGQRRKQVAEAKASWCLVLRLVRENNMERRLHRRELAYLEGDLLRSMSDKALGALRLAVADNEHLRDVLRRSEDPRYPERKIEFFIAVYQHLRERIRQDIMRTDDPVEAIEQMEIELNRLTEELTTREKKLAISARSVANIIRKTIQREQNRIRMLNQGLQNVAFGQVNSVRLNVNVRETHATLLTVLSEEQEQHQDLFNSQRLSFSEALAKLWQRLNPHIDVGQRTPQTLGEELLDYRNYLQLEVEVNRGSDGWLRAESGALSTGEAIGTGMAILVMVVQSWEDETSRLRAKDISPCRLLFLDEAARLDAKSIATLFELCERLEMQLIIAAPENISPEKGTTYKLMRKVMNNHEHVHVVGLKGFAQATTEMA